jgi:hypothetical protein
MKRTAIDERARKLRNCYQYERNRLDWMRTRKYAYRIPPLWDIGPTGRETRRTTVWHKLVRFCERQKIDPVHYIQWCLDIEQVVLDAPPEPNQLLAPARMTIYKEDLQKVVQRFKVRFMMQGRTARVVGDGSMPKKG